jgi:hypothetical protein
MSKPARRRSDKVLEMRSANDLLPQTSSAPVDDLHSAIAPRAFELYCQRGRRDGHDLDDWLHAEQEVLNAAQAIA